MTNTTNENELKEKIHEILDNKEFTEEEKVDKIRKINIPDDIKFRLIDELKQEKKDETIRDIYKQLCKDAKERNKSVEDFTEELINRLNNECEVIKKSYIFNYASVLMIAFSLITSGINSNIIKGLYILILIGNGVIYYLKQKRLQKVSIVLSTVQKVKERLPKLTMTNDSLDN